MFRQFFVLISSALSATIIPIHFNERNRPFISNVTTAAGDESNTHVMITLHPRSFSVSGPHQVDSRRTTTSLVLGNSYLLSSDNIAGPLSLSSPDPDMENLVCMGIGRGSNFLQGNQSISLLKNITSNRGLLVLNDSNAAHFNASCIPDSISAIPFDNPRGFRTRPRFSVSVQARLILPLGNEMVDTRHNYALIESEMDLGSPYPKMLSLPPAFNNEISRLINASGANRNASNPMIVTNCNFESLIEQLPRIKLSFPDAGADIIFLPEDYVQFNSDINVCRLNVYGDIEDDDFFAADPLKFNPLVVPNMNLHITNVGIRICDAL
jgi:hypothetical protein